MVKSRKKYKRRYYGKEYTLNGYYKDFFGTFNLYKFSSKKERDEWVSKAKYSGQRQPASGNDYAVDLGEHRTTMIKYLL